MATIKSPVGNYGGVTASIQFKNGVGQTDDPHLLDWFREHGYTVEEEKVQEDDGDTKGEEYNEKMGIVKLREIALVYGVDASKIPKKADIVAAIDAARVILEQQ